MDKLERIIAYNAQLYYEGRPEISDTEFDKLTKRLKEEFPDSILLKMTGWGYDPFKFAYGTKVNHRYQECKSIERKPRNIYDIPLDFTSQSLLRISAKLDGLSGVAYYQDGVMIQALTRGNGRVGIDVTNKHAVITKDSTYHKVFGDFTGAIRGEYVISNKNWEKICEIHKDDENPPKNQRNYAAGLINRNEVSEELEYIDFIPYKIIAWEDGNGFYDLRTITDKLHHMYKNIVMYEYTSGSELTQEYLYGLYMRFNSVYPCDGCVITKDILNTTGNSIEYDEVAYKFDAEALETTVKYVEWNLSRTGMLKPVAVLDPLDIDGSTVSRCTCFNAEYVKSNSIGEGAVITLIKSGEVIPDIQEVIKPADKPDLPSICPKCGHELSWRGKDIVCDNPDCEGADRSDLQHWTAILGEVHGLGGSIKDDFFDGNEIYKIEDMYLKLPNMKFGSSATEKKLDEMKSKLLYENIDAVRALVALNIPRLGWKSAEKIVESEMFSTLASLPDQYGLEIFDDSIHKIEEIVGQSTRKSIESNINKVSRLQYLKGRVVISKKSENSMESKGQVVITGKLSMKRKDFEQIIVDAGYEVSGKVTKDTKFLITDNPDGSSSKNKAANELGISKISEAEFMNMINK